MKNVQPDETANKLSMIRLPGFCLEDFSTHSCDSQEDIERQASGSRKLTELISRFVIDKRQYAKSSQHIYRWWLRCLPRARCPGRVFRRRFL
jgi:hypothetical protein